MCNLTSNQSKMRGVNTTVLFSLITYSTFSQNVGIGTTTPQAMLHVLATDSSQPSLIIENQGGSGYLILTGNGNLGIGTNNPSERVHVTGNFLFTGALMPNGNAGNAGQILISQGPNNPPIWIDTTTMGGDNWGSQVVQAQSPLIGDGTTGNPLGLSPGTNNGDVLVWNGSQWVVGTPPGDNWGSQVAQVQTPLIGDGTAANPLGLTNGANPNEILIWNGSAWTLALSDTLYWSTRGNVGDSLFFIGTTSNFPFRIFTNNLERMRITEQGLIGINTTAPKSLLSVGDTGSTYWTVSIKSPSPSTYNLIGGALIVEASGNYGHSHAIYGIISNNFSSTKQYGVRGRVFPPNPTNAGRSYGVWGEAGNANWNFGVLGTIIGTDTSSTAIMGWDQVMYPYPSYDAEAAMGGSGQSWAGYFYGDLYVQYDAVKPGGGTWIAPSDKKLKRNISPFTDGIEVIQNINPVNFQYNGLLGIDSTKVYIGVIAQEVAKVAPYAVHVKRIKVREKYEDILYFDPGVLTYVIINAIKEQQEMIELLMEQNKELISQLEQLKMQNQILSEKVKSLIPAN